MWKYLVTAGVSVAALIVSFLTLYYTRLDRGSIQMTQPLVIYLQPGDGKYRVSTIVFAALIHATADRGKYVESVYVCLEREDGIQYFSECRYEDRGVLRPGAFFVDKQGLGTNFHCWSPGYGARYAFLPGDYSLRVYVKMEGGEELLLGEEHLSVTREFYQAMHKRNQGVYFLWSPGSRGYIGHVGQTDLGKSM